MTTFKPTTEHLPAELHLSINTLIYGAATIWLFGKTPFIICDLKHLTEVIEKERIEKLTIIIEK